MVHSTPSAEPPRLTPQEIKALVLEVSQRLARHYEPGKDRVITPENVYQPAQPAGREDFEAFQLKLLLPGSRIEGLEHLDHCLERLAAGESCIFLPEHRGNLDVSSFNALLRAEDARYGEILRRLIYIAGRKLNESSDFIKMFTEKYARLVIVPRRELPRPAPGETAVQSAEREDDVKLAGRINRAAFREMIRLKREGYIFVLFPLGGRLKPDADNIPVKETASYLDGFDWAYPISMEGNTLPPLARMEDEYPIQDRVVFRVGPGLRCAELLAAEKARYARLKAAGRVPDHIDDEQFVANRIMEMLENLRLHGRYGEAP